jgi:hypothetical protein
MITIKIYSMTQTPLWIRPVFCNIPNRNEYIEEILQRVKKNQGLIGVKIAVEYSCPRAGINGKLLKGETLDDLYALAEKLGELSVDELKSYGLALKDMEMQDVKSMILHADRMRNEIGHNISQAW